MDSNQEKKIFINPSLEIVIFSNEDVICASEIIYIIHDEDDVP